MDRGESLNLGLPLNVRTPILQYLLALEPGGFVSATSITSIIRNIEDSRHIPEALLRTLVQKKSVTPEDADAALANATRTMAESLQAQGAALFMLGRAANRIVLQNVYFSPLVCGNDSAKRGLFQERAEQLEKMTLPINRPIAGQAILKGEAINITDASSLEHFYDPIEWSPDFEIRSLMAVPLIAGDRAVGCIEVINRCENKNVVAFTDRHLKLAQEVAFYAAKVIERALDMNVKLSDRDMAICLARLANCPFMQVEQNALDMPLLQLIGDKNLKRYQILPLKKLASNMLRAAMANPMDYQLIGDFEIVTGMKITEKVAAPASEIQSALLRVFPESSNFTEVAESIAKEYGADIAVETITDDEDENSAPIISLANRIIEDAYAAGASDIHIEPQEKTLLVRYRIDGVCRVKLSLPKHIHRALITRLKKIMSDLDIAERRLPQDGRIVYKKFNSAFDLDLRVASAPMNFGEAVVMRILDKAKSHLPLNALGFSSYNMEIYRRLIQIPYGMILHTGPTGSGKSMTLFAALNEINSPELKILTAEDPVEYTLAGVNQLHVRKEIGLSFANALRSFLRQDPDVILVGEIRDTETAEIAIEAALTGHVLFSTLHTNDAPSTISRLVEMGVEPFLISSTLACVCSQRLVRRLCLACKREDEPTPEERRWLERVKDDTKVTRVFRAEGCDRCDKTGYKGRIGIHELLRVTDDLRDLISKSASTEALREVARKEGMRTLFEDAMEKVKAGITSPQEALASAIASDV
jgi:type II secretory ATPase GspE/PulE/Tfp pilus assembly ATPase PilB-like protein